MSQPRRRNARKAPAKRMVRPRAQKPAPIQGRGQYQSKAPAKKQYKERGAGYEYGSKIGGLIGEGMQKLIKHFTGLGDYQVRENVFLTGRLPAVVNPSRGGNVIRFQEYLGDVFTSSTAGAFASRSYNINAANASAFPWLSQIAANYEQYAVEGMIYEFRSTSANALNSTNTALGSVMMATQYDIVDSAFTSKSEMLNYEYSNSCKPSENMIHMIECAPRMTSINELFCLAGSEVPAGTDARLYNLGRFVIATTGFQATSINIGELHVTYQIRLLKPKLFSTLGLNIPTITMTTGNGAAATYSNAQPLGLSTLLGFNNVAGQPIILYQNTAVDITTNQILFPLSNARLCWRIVITWSGATAVTPVFPVVTAFGCSLTSTFLSQTIAGSTICVAQYGIRYDGSGTFASLQFGAAGTLPAGNNFVIVRADLQPQDTLGQ